MELIKFVRSESAQAFKVIVLMSCVAGVANSALVALINAGAAAAGNEATATRNFFLFLASLALLAYASVSAATEGRVLMETAVSKLRIRIFDKLRKSDLGMLEALPRDEIIAKISKNVGQVLNATEILVAFWQSSLMMIACSLYLATISFSAFVVVMAGVGALGYGRYLRDRSQKARFEGLINQEGRQATFVSHLMDGFKETKINNAKSDALHKAYVETIEESKALGVQAGRRSIISGLYLQIGVYVLLLLTVFILPRYIPLFGEQIMQVTAVVLFLIGTFLPMVQTIPIFTQTDAALRDLRRLEEKLDKAVEEMPPPNKKLREEFKAFETIELRNITFTYQSPSGEPGFSVGPIDLTLNRGELLFVVGGNGSGKSTFLKLLTGLYQPQGGRITVDDHAVYKESLFFYRNIFAVIFGDFHLFDRFYGCEEVDHDKVRELIRLMKLEDKVQFKDGRFSTLNLSTGQRKRLALIAALVEDKEVYIFDEWAADQDHHFRRYFYEVILANLKAAGKTVVVVTHDDAYWGVADRLVKFDYGRVVLAEPLFALAAGA